MPKILMGPGRPTIEGPSRWVHLVDITSHFGPQLSWTALHSIKRLANKRNYLAFPRRWLLEMMWPLGVASHWAC